ncbi:MAG: endonuclease [Proteobacteria bacterium]|nr:MAG: endonuclease [Pseudomonadota bacterium]
MSVSVATYNVHRCIGSDGHRDTARVLAVLRELDADVVALQELEWHTETERDVLASFAGALQSVGIPGPTVPLPGGHYGNALLTRLPVRDIRHIDLSVSGREQRSALDVTVEASDGALRVVATHLGLAPMERRHQIRRILAMLPKSRHEPLVLMGDLNEWFLWGRPLRWLQAHFGKMPAPATFPSRFPIMALDRIWVQPVALRGGAVAHSSSIARQASDHLPLRMSLGGKAPTPRTVPEP